MKLAESIIPQNWRVVANKANCLLRMFMALLRLEMAASLEKNCYGEGNSNHVQIFGKVIKIHLHKTCVLELFTTECNIKILNSCLYYE